MSAGPSLDHLVRAQQQRLRDVQAERFRSLEVDDQLELRGLQDGQIGGFRPLENLVDVRGRSTVQVDVIWTIRDQCAVPRCGWEGEYCRQAVAKFGQTEHVTSGARHA